MSGADWGYSIYIAMGCQVLCPISYNIVHNSIRFLVKCAMTDPYNDRLFE
jgi:hypothetical protein